jgi:hypothetical protein
MLLEALKERTMKRMQLIAAALCLVMIATIGAGVVVAKQTENPRQSGESSIYFYDVAPTDTNGTGKLQIDVAKHTFVFNGKDFTPDAMIELKAKAEDGSDNVFATGKATPSGNLHIAGEWEAGAALPGEVAAGYQAIGSFTLYNGGWFVIQLKAYYSFDNGATWHETETAIKGIANGHTGFAPDLADLGVPDGNLVRIHAVVVGGKDRTGSEVFQSYPQSYTAWTATYEITGVTWNPTLTYDGYFNAGFPDPCDPPGCVN